MESRHDFCKFCLRKWLSAI
ncbi:hypothetical protein [Pseudoalteromonas sp. Angola-7]